jgi:hypothetical protein
MNLRRRTSGCLRNAKTELPTAAASVCYRPLAAWRNARSMLTPAGVSARPRLRSVRLQCERG